MNLNFRSFFNLYTLFALLASLLGGAVFITPAHASTLTVNTLVDENDGSCTNGDCSLRDAINTSNTNDTITFSVTGTINLTLGELVIGLGLTITGPDNTDASQLIIDAGEDSRVLNIITGDNVSISNLTLQNGKVTDANGAGIRSASGASLNLNNVAILNNSAVKNSLTFVRGGGIEANGKLTITNSIISGNEAEFQGGGIYFFNGSSITLKNVEIKNNDHVGISGGGGGIALDTVTLATFDAIDVSGNGASNTGGIYIGNVTTLNMVKSLIANNTTTNSGGGLVLSGVAGQVANITNTTVSGNVTSDTSSFGAGILVDGIDSYTVNLAHVTITQNTTQNGGGGGIKLIGSGTINLKNSILAGNTAFGSTDADCNGNITSQNYNLIQDTDGCVMSGVLTNNVTGSSPLLNPLADNGGFTKTHAPQALSPALNAIPKLANGCGSAYLQDQRGAPRPQKSACEIGAFEEIVPLNLVSSPAQDGWVLESSETSNQGGTLNTAATLLNVGDAVDDKQYKSLLSFNTSGLPDQIVITKVKLKIKIQGFAGGNMFTPTNTLGNLLIDIRKSRFGTSANLELVDFQSAANQNNVGVLASAPSAGFYTIILQSTAYDFINLKGTTQFRLRFQKDDNDDLGADYLKIFSGNAPAANRPRLIVEYVIP